MTLTITITITITIINRDNKGRYHPQRDDGSIFVSLGTYRDPYCPMTIKSLYSQAAHPEKVNCSTDRLQLFLDV